MLSQALAFFNEYEIVIYKSNDFLSLAIYITLWHVKLTCCKYSYVVNVQGVSGAGLVDIFPPATCSTRFK